MYLRSIEGKILFEGRFSSVKRGVEMAVEDRVDLSNINLRQANLMGANIDNAIMPAASLWGANLKGANMAGGDYTACDFRTANLADTCMAETTNNLGDFRGSYFSKTIFRGANLSHAKFSCPSIFSVELSEVSDMNGAVYYHMGEQKCDLSRAPLIIRGLQKPLIFLEDRVLVGNKMIKSALKERVLKNILEPIVENKIFISQ